MKLVLLIGEILLGSLLVTNAMAEPGQPPNAALIPLKDIWAYEMPGTRDVHELEPDMFGLKIRKLSSAEQIALSEKSLTTQILYPLGHNKPGQTAIQAFAVTGTGVDALRKAADILSGKKKPQTSFPANSDVSVVFFSYLYGSYVHLNNVEQQPGLINITYRFVPHETANLTRHFALGPIPKYVNGCYFRA